MKDKKENGETCEERIEERMNMQEGKTRGIKEDRKQR